MMGYGFGYGGLGWGISMFLSMLFPILLIAGAIFLAQKLWPGGKTGSEKVEQDPVTIIKTRYAKGEITKEEFNLLKAELKE